MCERELITTDSLTLMMNHKSILGMFCVADINNNIAIKDHNLFYCPIIAKLHKT